MAAKLGSFALISSLPAGRGSRFATPQFVSQPQDHFDPTNTRTWQQAYYVNDDHWVPGTDAPIFLCTVGEWAIESLEAGVCGNAEDWLPQTKGLMFGLEHRYYGCHNAKACPVQNDGSEPNLFKYLSSRQAIEDVANFVQAMSSQHNLTTNKWVTWGGSYAGMVAGWSRLQHPQLIHAAVASSAPVNAKLDFAEYMNHVSFAYSVSDNMVGGSPECEAAIVAGHRQLEKMFSTDDGIHEAEKLFDLRIGALRSLDDRRDFAGDGVATFPAQRNKVQCTDAGCNIKEICKVMVDSTIGSELQRLKHLRAIQCESGGANCKDSTTFQERATAHENQFVGVGSGHSLAPQWYLDSWNYQKCTEFGFFKTCELNSTCMYVRGLVDIDYMLTICDSFNISGRQVQKAIQSTNEHYGALEPVGPDGQVGSCVLWVNGEVDPWSELGVLEAPVPEQPVLHVPGASHCAWIYPENRIAQDSVFQARQIIRNQTLRFLSRQCFPVSDLVV